MVQENKLLEEELLAFYTQNECVYIVGTWQLTLQVENNQHQ